MMTIAAVIPCYNQAHYLGEAIESVLAQTRPADEIIVVNDGSTDETAAVAARYSPVVRYIWQENRGLAGARNSGMEAASSEWIGLLDSDDRWLPDRLLLQCAVLEGETGTCLVHGSYHRIDADGAFVDVKLHEQDAMMDAHSILTYNPIAVCTTLFPRKHALDLGGFDTNTCACEDRDMWIRLAARLPIRGVQRPVGEYRIYPASMSGDPVRMYRGRMYVLRKNRDVHGGNCPGCYAASREGMRNARHALHETVGWMCAAGFAAYERGDWREAWCHYRRAIRAWPGVLRDVGLLRVLASLAKRSMVGMPKINEDKG